MAGMQFRESGVQAREARQEPEGPQVPEQAPGSAAEALKFSLRDSVQLN